MCAGAGNQAARAVVNSLLSMAGASLSAMVLSRAFLDRKWNCTRPNAASLAGLVRPPWPPHSSFPLPKKPTPLKENIKAVLTSYACSSCIMKVIAEAQHRKFANSEASNA